MRITIYLHSNPTGIPKYITPDPSHEILALYATPVIIKQVLVVILYYAKPIIINNINTHSNISLSHTHTHIISLLTNTTKKYPFYDVHSKTVINSLKMSRGDNFVIKMNNFSFMTHILRWLRRFYRTALECTRVKLNNDGFMYRNVIVFTPRVYLINLKSLD